MIFKVRKHRSKLHLRNLVRYLLSRKGKSNERVLRHESLNALPMLPGDTPPSYAKQWAGGLWAFTAKERCGKKPPEDHFVHSVLSFFPGNGEHQADKLTADEAVELAKEAMAEVAPGERQALYVVHGDKAHLHVHIVFSVVEIGGRIWNPRIDFRLWEAAAARLEVKHGLHQVTVGRPGGEPARRRSPAGNELSMTLRTGQPSDRMLLQQLIDAALAGRPSFPKFWQRLLDAGIIPVPRVASTGRVSGISFQYQGGLPMKGSDLGKGYSWHSLAKHLNFAESQHLHLLRPFANDQSALGSIAFEVDEAVTNSLPELLPPLKRFFAKTVGDRIDWVWRNKPARTAFVESTKLCVARSTHPAVYEALAERAQVRGLKRVGVTGSEAFRRRLWYEMALRDIELVGYEPTDADYYRLQWWMNEQAENGRGTDTARVGKSNRKNVTGIGHEAGCDAGGEGVDERRASGDDVSLATGDDFARPGESGVAQGNAPAHAQRDSTDEVGDERAALPVGRTQSPAHLNESADRLSRKEVAPAYLRRASRLGEAALLRNSVCPVTESQGWRETINMLWELERRFTHWSIDFGVPEQRLLGALSRSDELAANWPNLQVLNSQGYNVQLSLTSTGSWLHLTGVTATDLQLLLKRKIVPTIHFTVAGVTEAYVHVNYGCESKQVMARLAEQVQTGLQANVRAHLGSVSFPLPGFDRWQDEQPQQCSNASFNSETMGMQLSVQLRELKGEVGPRRILGALPSVRSAAMRTTDEKVRGRVTSDLSEWKT